MNMNKLLSFFYLSGLAVCLAGCGSDPFAAPRSNRTAPKALEVLPHTGVNYGCECGSAKVYSIKNPNNFIVNEDIVQYSRDLRDSSSSVTSKAISIRLDANSTRSKMSACSYEKVRGSCTMVNVLEVQGINYPSDTGVISRQAVSNIVVDNLVALGATPNINQGFNCVDRCNSGDTSVCVRKSIRGTPDVGDAIAVRDMLGNRNANDDAIPIEKIVALIKGQQNTCDRTDIVFKNGNIYNFGSNCSAKGYLPDGGSMVIEIPSNFSARYYTDLSANFGIQFRETLASPKVTLSIPGLPTEVLYGHHIRYINGTFYMKVAKENDSYGTCLALDL